MRRVKPGVAALFLVGGLNLHMAAGATWHLETLPVPQHSDRSLLGRISCTSATRCMAVGYYASTFEIEYPLVEVRNGATWRIVPTPKPTSAADGVLGGVSCVTASKCMTVGSWTNSSDLNFPLSEWWNGTSWVMRSPPLPAGATSGSLSDVTCASAASCTAVGSYILHHGVQNTLVEVWNGHSWAIRSSPNIPGAEATTLASISCPGAKTCLAVGRSTSAGDVNVPVAEAWNGTTWRTMSIPAPSGTASRRWAELIGLSCSRPTACMATGDYALSNSARFVALAEWWNGVSWKLLKPIRPVGTSKSPLTGVACSTPTECTAVGFAAGKNVTTTLAEFWNGSSWSIEPTPNPAGLTLSDLVDVACRSVTVCTASGYAGTGGVDHPLGETTHP